MATMCAWGTGVAHGTPGAAGAVCWRLTRQAPRDCDSDLPCGSAALPVPQVDYVVFINETLMWTNKVGCRGEGGESGGWGRHARVGSTADDSFGASPPHHLPCCLRRHVRDTPAPAPRMPPTL